MGRSSPLLLGYLATESHFHPSVSCWDTTCLWVHFPWGRRQRTFILWASVISGRLEPDRYHLRQKHECSMWWHTWLVNHSSLLANSTKWAQTQHHKSRRQLLEEPASSSESFGQTCFCLSNHTRRYERSRDCVLLLSLQMGTSPNDENQLPGLGRNFWRMGVNTLYLGNMKSLSCSPAITCVCDSSWSPQE